MTNLTLNEKTKQMKKNMMKLDQWMIDYIKGYDLKVLTLNDTPLNVSYTESGLRWTSDKQGRFIFFNDSKRFISDSYATVLGNEKNPHIAIKPYIPQNHYDEKGNLDIRKQLAELYVIDKAMRLLTPMNVNRQEIPTMNKYSESEY